MSLRAFHSFRIGVRISSGCGCRQCFCRGFTLTSCDTTPYRRSWSWSWSWWRHLAWFLECCCRGPGSLILSAEAPAVGDVFCIRCQTLGSLILSAEALAVGVFGSLIRSFMHVRFGSLTYLCRWTISERLISGICFFDIFLIFKQSNNVDLIGSILTQPGCIPFSIEDDFLLGFDPVELWFLYHPQRLWVVCVAYHYTGRCSRAKRSFTEFNFGNESTGVASQSL